MKSWFLMVPAMIPITRTNPSICPWSKKKIWWNLKICVMWYMPKISWLNNVTMMQNVRSRFIYDRTSDSYSINLWHDVRLYWCYRSVDWIMHDRRSGYIYVILQMLLRNVFKVFFKIKRWARWIAKSVQRCLHRDPINHNHNHNHNNNHNNYNNKLWLQTESDWNWVE